MEIFLKNIMVIIICDAFLDWLLTLVILKYKIGKIDKFKLWIDFYIEIYKSTKSERI